MLRFGDFTFDPVTGELRRGEAIERLGPQTSRVLQLLVERPGEVITRDQFRREVWPDTTVEFDQGLNTCIRQLRVALNDDATSPRYIETLPRRGYRFREAVTNGASAEGASQLNSKRGDGGTMRWRLGLAAILLVAVVSVGTFISQRFNPPRPVLAIVPFDADSGVDDLGVYRDELAESMVTGVTTRAAPQIVIVGPSMTKTFGSRTPIDTIRSRLGAAYALSGVVRRRPDGFDVFAQLVRASDRAHVWAFRSVDSSAFADAGRLGASIADSVSSILLHPERPRKPRGFETR
jgi:DNA-binding winged helix-turn-helix (wHTH) protein/TolB-like protein